MIALLLVQLCAANGRAVVDRANQLAGLASDDFEHGRYAEAAREYHEADLVAPKASLLLKEAKAYEKAGELAKAAEAYRAFLRRSPTASNRAAIKREIARLTRQAKRHLGDSLALVPLSQPENPLALVPLSPSSNPLALEPLAPAAPAEPSTAAVAEGSPAPPAPVAEAAAEAPHKSIAPVLVTTLGAIAVAGAVGCGYWGGWGLDALLASQHNQSVSPAPERSQFDTQNNQLQLQAEVWLSIAGVLGATGLYFLIAGPSWGSASEASTVSAVPMAGGGGLVYSGTFQ